MIMTTPSCGRNLLSFQEFSITCAVTASGVDLTTTTNTISCTVVNLDAGIPTVLTIPSGRLRDIEPNILHR